MCAIQGNCVYFNELSRKDRLPNSAHLSTTLGDKRATMSGILRQNQENPKV